MSWKLADRLRKAASKIEGDTRIAAVNPWNSLREFISKQREEYDRECEKLLVSMGKEIEKRAEEYRYGTLSIKDSSFTRKTADVRGRLTEWTVFVYEVETDINNMDLEDIGTDVLGAGAARMHGLVSVEGAFGAKGITLTIISPGARRRP